MQDNLRDNYVKLKSHFFLNSMWVFLSEFITMVLDVEYQERGDAFSRMDEELYGSDGIFTIKSLRY